MCLSRVHSVQTSQFSTDEPNSVLNDIKELISSANVKVEKNGWMTTTQEHNAGVSKDDK